MKDIEIFNKHSQPEPWALKEIMAGRMKGKTDINPQWRIFALTEMFGLVGFGWKYQIDNIQYKEASNGEVAVMAHISLFVKKDDKWSEAIVGTGGSMFIANEKNGPYVSDEAEKMAITDAISVACKQLGIAGNIYSGSKYLPAYTKANPEPAKKEELTPTHKGWQGAIKALVDGTVTISKIRVKYELSKNNEELLISESTK